MLRTPFGSHAFVVSLAVLGGACSKEPAPAPGPTAPPQAPAAAPAAPAAAPEPVVTLDPTQLAEEACGQILVVSYAGAAHAKEGVTRDKDAARARATELLAKVRAGADFAALAKTDSDAPSSAASGGIMGTFGRSEWPAIHKPLEATVYGLAVDAVAPNVVETPYGFVLVRRCAVEKAHSRHVLIRYQGAQNAGPEVTRTKQDAFKLASEIQRKLTSGSDFAEVARENSEDSSAERGGDVGSHGRGRLAAAYEEALFKMKVGEISVVVESENGYHVIQRLPPDVEPTVADVPVAPEPESEVDIAKAAADAKEAKAAPTAKPAAKPAAAKVRAAK